MKISLKQYALLAVCLLSFIGSFSFVNNFLYSTVSEIPTTSVTAASALVPGGFIFGVTAGEGMSSSFMKGLNLTSTRTWYEVRDWNNPPSSASFDYLRDYKKRGITTVVVFNGVENSSVMPTYIQAYNFFKNAAKAANGAVDYWEIGNEPNLKTYWPGSMTQYVNTLQKGAWDALHPLGEVTISGSVSWDANALKTPGLTTYADIIGFHPYGGSGENSASQQISRIKQARVNVGSTKPMFLTEWNVHYRKSKTDTSYDEKKWAAQLPIAYNGIKNQVQGIWYYPSKFRADSMAGPAGLRNSAGTEANEPFYSTYKSITGGSGGGITGDTGGSTGGGNTGGGSTGGGSTGGGTTGGGSTGGGVFDGGSGGSEPIDLGGYDGSIGSSTDYTGTDRNDVNQGQYTGSLSKCITDPSPANCADGLATQQCKNATDVAACKKDFINKNTTPTTTGTGLPPTPSITPSGAGGLIPCNGTDCDFAAFIRLIKNIINAMFIIAGPLAAISFSYAGWLYLTSQGNVTKTARAKSIFTTVLIGFIILLSAWLIVTTVLTALLTPDVLNKLPIKLGS